jgi:hypothetical protein
MDRSVKKYIIPTKSWLNDFLQLGTTLNYNKYDEFSNIINTKNILIKITFGRSHKLRLINQSIKKLPNMVHTYYVLYCDNYFPIFFKNINIDNLKNRICSTTLEIMKFYNGNSLNYINNIDLETFKNISFQLILAQINLFMIYGLTHCKIHPGNILIHKYKNEIELKYVGLINIQTIKTNTEYILCDYDDCFAFTKFDYIDGNISSYGELSKDDIKNIIWPNSLFINIKTTLHILINKIKDTQKLKIQNMIDSLINHHELNIINNEIEYLYKYINNSFASSDYNLYKKIVHDNMIIFYNKFKNLIIDI